MMFGRFRAAQNRAYFLAECTSFLPAAAGLSKKAAFDYTDDYQALFVSCHERGVSPEDAILIVANSVLQAFVKGESVRGISPYSRSEAAEVTSYEIIKKYCEVIESEIGKAQVPPEFLSLISQYIRRRDSI